MRNAYNAKKLSNWDSFKEECRREGKLCEWTFERIREAHDKGAMEDIGRLSCAQDIFRKNTDFLRRIIAPVGGMEESLCRTFARLATVSLWMTTYGGVSTGHGDGNNRKKKHCNSWCAEATMSGERPTGF